MITDTTSTSTSTKYSYPDEISELQSKDIKVCDHISTYTDSEVFINPCMGDPTERGVTSGGFLSDQGVLDISHPSVYHDSGIKYQKAGPRKHVSFNNSKVTAAILTCGGICPGLNVVIRELVMTLRFNFQVQNVYGIKYGYMGIYQDPKETYISLTADLVKNIHKEGGTILGSSRGGFELDKIVDGLVANNISMLYVIGGDGTHRGIQKIADECKARKLKITVCGIPKTIDNDIPIIDRTFGFESAVEQSVKVIEAAKVEARSALNGVGIVKLFGRSCGFISLFASLASRDVNICLIPESKFELYGEKGLLEYVVKRVKQRGSAVIVIAEGCGDAVVDLNVADTGVLDKSGNKILPVSSLFFKF